ncbi:MAG: 5-oxoprolinase subunit PxpA [Aeoliella sp.]
MPASIDLNCDVGEVSFERDYSLLPLFSSCNVSCGVHAGDSVLIGSTLREALRLGVAVGAHPSYPDRTNFGRISMDLPPTELAEQLRDQIAKIQGMVESLGGRLQHVKPHGALYHDVAKDVHLAETVVEVVRQLSPTLAFYGQSGSHLAEICENKQVRFVHEAFGDRRYQNRTTLRSRAHTDAVLSDREEFQQQLLSLLEGFVVDVDGQKHALCVQTICLHSDTPQALEFAQLARHTCKEHHVRLAAP